MPNGAGRWVCAIVTQPIAVWSRYASLGRGNLLSKTGIRLVVAVCVLPSLAAGVEPEEFTYTHFGETIRLEVAPDELSVGFRPGADLGPTLVFGLESGIEESVATRLHGDTGRVTLGKPAPDLDLTQRMDLVGEPLFTAPGQRRVGVKSKERRDPSPNRYLESLGQLLDTPGVNWAYVALRNSKTGTLLFPTPTIVVRVREEVHSSRFAELLPADLKLVRKLRLVDHQYLVALSNPQSDHPVLAARRLEDDHEWVEWADPNFVQEWQHAMVPNDPLYPDQWHLHNDGTAGDPPGTSGADARAEAGWDIESGDGSVVIAVIDDGVELDHPDLQSQVFTNLGEIPGNLVDDDGNGYVDDVKGWDFYDNDNDPNPDLTGPGSHGTAVAGVAAARGNNGIGGTGSCQNCRILPVRIAGPSQFCDNSSTAEAIAYSGQFADVLNNSWGSGSPSSAITNAIQQVTSEGRGGLGAPTIFASGNSASGYFVNFTPLIDLPAGSYIFQWAYVKDANGTAGFDTVWLDNVIYPDGTVFDFESGFPGGWFSAGDASWERVCDETRASSERGGRCVLKAGQLGHDEDTSLIDMPTFASSGDLSFSFWVSSEVDSADGEGAIQGGTCKDGFGFLLWDGTGSLIWKSQLICGTWSNQDRRLQDGTVSYPASLTETIAVGAATNFDLRSDYSQWGQELDFVAHSGGGSAGVTTTDVSGSSGYSNGDYWDSFGGTSSAAPLASGVAGLLISRFPDLTESEVRSHLRASARKIGSPPYSNGRNDQYGYGVIDAGSSLSPSTPGISLGDASVREGDSGTTLVEFAIDLRTPAGGTVSVDWSTSDGTATSADYAPSSGTVWFAPGETSKTIAVTVYGDVEVEPDEIFYVDLSDPSNAMIEDGQGWGKILDDDTPDIVTLFDQTDYESGWAAPVQDFETARDDEDCEAADDFVVTGGGWLIYGVELRGAYMDGSGPTEGINIWFYEDDGGWPSFSTVCSYSEVEPIYDGAVEDEFGMLLFDLPTPCVLGPGRYWMATQARMDYAAGGQFFWSQRTNLTGIEGVWRQPGDEYGWGYTSWTRLTEIVPESASPDLVFRLTGADNLPPIFVDGFESGNTSAWSNTVP